MQSLKAAGQKLHQHTYMMINLIQGVDGDHIDAETEGHLLDHRQQLMEPVLGVEKAKALIQHWWTAPLTEQLLPPQLWI